MQTDPAALLVVSRLIVVHSILHIYRGRFPLSSLFHQRLHCKLGSGSFGYSEVGSLTQELSPVHAQRTRDLSIGKFFRFAMKELKNKTHLNEVTLTE